MKYIVVIAGNRRQFVNYVDSQMENLPNYKWSNGKAIIEGTTYMYIDNYLNLSGYNLGISAKLVKIGTWYELPTEDVEAIEKMFAVRKR